MAKKTLVNAETNNSVEEFIHSIENKVRKEDSKLLLQLIQDVSGLQPKIWGKNIIGFGKYKYQRKNGDEFEWFTVGFSPGKAHLSLYVMYDLEKEEELLSQLGPYKNGRGCLYIKKLEEIDVEVLKKLIAKSKAWNQ